MKRIWLVLILLSSIAISTSACRDDSDGLLPGYYAHPDLLAKMQTDFDEEATQAQSKKSFSELSIVFVPYDPFIGFWLFIEPNTIELAIPVYSNFWKAAARQYLLSNAIAPLSQSGIFFSERLINQWAIRFQKTKACTGFRHGEFQNLVIWAMTPSFPCSFYGGFCGGLYESPNEIFLGYSSFDKHEFIHFLLWVNTGDDDSNHQSPFFVTCV